MGDTLAALKTRSGKVVILGALLGGPIGVGTLYSTFATGPVTQGMYRLFRFDPTAVTHQDLLTSLGLLLGRKR